ncbi:MFS transporter [Microbacterium sp. 77mftsu3.1]|uniref:MFS transporter n=1 Tax=Microbacterium sp. 77mftsu3.1 TaxID=1761802 RepID=UPI00036F5A75|nr:MFS transporter [Microbacterium sp. 77mftsu3.1]SDG71729.1 Major Facilitator Superfamily protein [Microbacterium sp. 77mftsu3.1]
MGRARPKVSPTTGGRSRSQWKIFVVLVGAAALTILDVSKLGVALPAIQADMGGDPVTVQLMLVGYTLAYAATLLPAGRIGDVLPRRAVFLVGLTVFTAASVVCALAPTVEILVLARVIEGVGAGLLMPQVLGFIQRIFPAGERAKPLAALAAVTSLTSLAAPVLAGVILDAFGDRIGWRVLFFVTVIAGAILIPAAAIVVREPPAERRRGFDGVGAALLAVGVVLVIGPLSATSQSLPFAPWMLIVTGGGVMLILVFVFHERRTVRRRREALIDPTLFRLPHLSAGVLISGCMHAAATAGTLIVTIGLQQIGRLTPLDTALWMLPAAAASLLGSWFASRIDPVDGKVVVLGGAAGAIAVAATGVAFAVAGPELLPGVVAALLCLSAFGAGLSAPANQARTLLYAPDHRSSAAGSLIQFAQRVGSAIGMAIALIIYYAFLTDITFAGQPAAGPALALGVVSVFLVAAAALAAGDRARAAVAQVPKTSFAADRARV